MAETGFQSILAHDDWELTGSFEIAVTVVPLLPTVVFLIKVPPQPSSDDSPNVHEVLALAAELTLAGEAIEVAALNYVIVIFFPIGMVRHLF